MTTMLKFTVILCTLTLVVAQNPVVETTLGKIKGSTLKTVTGLEFNAFRGIRYAQAPIGKWRFATPIAVGAWQTEYDATKDGKMCPQSGRLAALLAEDCLFINVYSHRLSRSKPVIVYIHGGANKAGGSHSVSEAGPEYLMESDIVLVTFNYRLGALGFLSTGTREARGNYAYLDQVLALKWVNEHISRFDGNPKSVTLLGISAGAMAITLHMSSPLSVGLFHGAIAMSGSATNTYAIDNLHWTTQLAKEASCPMYNPSDLVSCLRDVPWERILEVTNSWEPYFFINIKWNYEVDGYFLTQTPTEAFMTGNFSKVPILAGITRDEFRYMVYWQEGNTRLFNDISLNFDRYAPELFMFEAQDASTGRDAKIQNFYLSNKTINDQSIENFGDIFSDAIINHGVHRLVQLAKDHVEVYYYRFDYAGRYGLYNDADSRPRGIGHGDDFQYVFKSAGFASQIASGDPEWFMVERLVGWFSSFGQKRIPAVAGDVQWLPVNKTHVNTMYNGKDLKLDGEPYQEKYKLWDELFPLSSGGSGTVYATVFFTALVTIMHVFVKNIFH